MGEYIKIKGQADYFKIGTCEEMYYIRLEQLRQLVATNQAEKVDGNQEPREYLEPETNRFRFPFPDEDNVEPGYFDPYNRGVEIALTPDVTPLIIADLTAGGEDWDHNTLTTRQGDVNIMGIPCPYNPEFEKMGLSVSWPFPNYRVELVQQKLMKSGEVWAVVRCVYCGAMVRLDMPRGTELAAACLLNEPIDFYQELARRIQAGYWEGHKHDN